MAGMLEHPTETGSQPAPTAPRRTLAVWLATGLGVGLVAPAPGTIGGLWGIPIAVAISHVPGWWLQITVIALLCAAGVPLCDRAVRDLGGVKDPGAIVFDEIASIPIVFLFLPAITVNLWWVLVLGFALHRLFDITKPPPTRLLERLPGGLGVMADDWMAGIYSCAALNAVVSVWKT